MGKLDGKVAIVTGGGTGIGKGIARAFAAEGARVVIASRSEQALNDAAQEIEGSVLGVPTDLKVEAQVVALFERTLAEMGRLDIVVNNSGVFEGGPLEELSLETWQHVMDVNLTGVFLCSREAMKIMKARGGGRIINIGSISAQMPRMNSAPYTTTKHALVGLTKSTALEGREYGVVASILHPGNVLTELRDNSVLAQNQEPMMSTDDIAMAALTMAALPLNVNMLESIVLPVEQKYIGRG
jgi:NAD(P)-dependent dehydrogenase (short-subunit alcohol dehydrogenase family)